MTLATFGKTPVPRKRLSQCRIAALALSLTFSSLSAQALTPTCESLFRPHTTFQLTTQINRPLLNAFLNAVHLGKGIDGISGEALVPAFKAFTPTQLFALNQAGLGDFPYVVGQSRRGHMIAVQFSSTAKDPYFKVLVIKNLGRTSGTFFNMIEARDRSPVLREISEANGKFDDTVSAFVAERRSFIALASADTGETLNVFQLGSESFLVRQLMMHSRKLDERQIFEFLEALRDI